MLFLFYTDLHLNPKNPRHRIDDFPAALLAKLREIYSIAESEKVDFVIFGGDFFNAYRTYSYRLFIDAIDAITVKTYGIIGQHDLKGYNYETLKTSSLGFFEYFCDNFQTIYEPLDFDDALICPCHVYDDLKIIASQPVSRKKKSILVAHKLLSDKEEVFDTFSTASLACNFNLCLAGDYHMGFSQHTVGDTLYYNPGSIARISTKDIGRQVKVALIRCEAGKPIEIREIPLTSAKPAEEVFGESIIEEVREQVQMQMDASSFTNGFAELERESTDVFDLLEKIGKKKAIRKPVMDYIMSKRE